MRRLFALSMLLAAGFAGTLHAQETQNGTPSEPAKKVKAQKNRISSPEYEISNSRIDAIEEIVQKVVEKFYNKRADLKSSETLESIKAEIGNMIANEIKIPLVPEKPADSRTMLQISESQQSLVNKKYPVSQEKIRKIADEEAMKKYPMAKRGDEVTITYRRGSSMHTVKGHFYGFGIGNKSIRINSRYVPYFDLSPEAKALFDKNANAELRKQYVSARLQNQLQDRRKYADQLYTAEAAKVRQQNEQLGYIYRKTVETVEVTVNKRKRERRVEKSKWDSAETVMNEFLNESLTKYQAKAAARAAEEQQKNQDKDQNGENQNNTQETES